MFSHAHDVAQGARHKGQQGVHFTAHHSKKAYDSVAKLKWMPMQNLLLSSHRNEVIVGMAMNDRLECVNSSAIETCVQMLEGLVELSPWIVHRAMDARPFATTEAMIVALTDAIRMATPEEQLTLILAHGDLVGRASHETSLTQESQSEQGRLGLLALSDDHLHRLQGLNAAYRARFHMPFIVALHRMPDLAAVFRNLEARLKNTVAHERETALAEIMSVTRNRAEAFFEVEGAEPWQHARNQTAQPAQPAQPAQTAKESAGAPKQSRPIPSVGPLKHSRTRQGEPHEHPDPKRGLSRPRTCCRSTSGSTCFV
ncbi:MAG: 2-oxo-4-hydroxy-4-carboxy-5-ureidoimidazoline decarboxylase [Roseinatronobacter sp.]